MSPIPEPRRALGLLLALCLVCAGCTGLGRAEEVKVDARTLQLEQMDMGQLNAPGVDPDTLWTLEVQYLAQDGTVLTDKVVEVAFLPGQWRSELAPIRI